MLQYRPILYWFILACHGASREQSREHRGPVPVADNLISSTILFALDGPSRDPVRSPWTFQMRCLIVLADFWSSLQRALLMDLFKL